MALGSGDGFGGSVQYAAHRQTQAFEAVVSKEVGGVERGSAVIGIGGGEA